MKVTTIHILVRDDQDFDNDGNACDFLAEALRNLEFRTAKEETALLDWAYACPSKPWKEYVREDPTVDYEEGEFISFADEGHACKY